MVLFGDGHRDYHTDYDAFETAYYLGQLDNSDVLKKEFGALINSGLASKQYRRPVVEATNRTGEVYKQPVELLWFSPTIEGAVQDYPLPTTDELPFAGIVVQRNLSTTNNEKDALMGFVGGASFVHGHASGMNLELYGRGQVLGSKAGRGTYTTDLHENYYRLFAGHNTVIVNGASEGSGGWANLGMNRVETVALEPAVRKQRRFRLTTRFLRPDLLTTKAIRPKLRRNALWPLCAHRQQRGITSIFSAQNQPCPTSFTTTSITTWATG